MCGQFVRRGLIPPTGRIVSQPGRRWGEGGREAASPFCERREERGGDGVTRGAPARLTTAANRRTARGGVPNILDCGNNGCSLCNPGAGPVGRRLPLPSVLPGLERDAAHLWRARCIAEERSWCAIWMRPPEHLRCPVAAPWAALFAGGMGSREAVENLIYINPSSQELTSPSTPRAPVLLLMDMTSNCAHNRVLCVLSTLALAGSCKSRVDSGVNVWLLLSDNHSRAMAPKAPCFLSH